MKEFEAVHEVKEKEHPVPSTSQETLDSASFLCSSDSMVVEGDAGSEKTGGHFPATKANKGTQLTYKRPIYRSKGILI